MATGLCSLSVGRPPRGWTSVLALRPRNPNPNPNPKGGDGTPKPKPARRWDGLLQ